MNHRIGCPALPTPGNVLGMGECTCKHLKMTRDTRLIHTFTLVVTEQERCRLQSALKQAYMDLEGTNGGVLKDLHDAIFHPEGANW